MNNLPNSQQVSLRDALEVVPVFDGTNKVPFSYFEEACYEARSMLPNNEAQENLVKLLRSKITGEARKCIHGYTFNSIEEIINKLKAVYAPRKTVYQLQGELGNIYMFENENVISYASRIKEITHSIVDAHKLNNHGVASKQFEKELEKFAIDHFIRGLKPELEIRIKTAETFSELITTAIEIERRLATNKEIRKETRSTP